MRYAEVAVDAPIGFDKTLSYSIPSQLDVCPGQMAWVPLGVRPVQGMVFQLAERPQVDVVKDIIASVEPSPLITSVGLELARWISRYYLAPLFDSVALMMPPGFQSRVRSYVRADYQEVEASPDLDPMEKESLDFFSRRAEVKENEIVKALGGDGEKLMNRLLRKGLLHRRWELPRPTMSHRYDCFIRPALSGIQAEEIAPALSKSPRQMALYQALIASAGPLPLSVANKEYGGAAVKGLLSKGPAGP